MVLRSEISEHIDLVLAFLYIVPRRYKNKRWHWQRSPILLLGRCCLSVDSTVYSTDGCTVFHADADTLLKQACACVQFFHCLPTYVGSRDVVC